ncbi:MAG: MFS transporter [Candidatus Aramenus sulfurataquae]|uniref:MFS transporter n=4 Tax=Candidatus Aramenus sulfurataquae TaxID=1326980 RepID=A0AAE3K5R4_9CREN|nr:MFS transporter [Candidatus Aramenus sulfurataquae]
MRGVAPYWILVFSIGFGWFILAPLVPVVASTFKVSVSMVVLLISAYGYAMAILGLLAGLLSAKFSVRASLLASSVLTSVGLLGRALSTNFAEFLAFSLLGAMAYPLAVAPLGSIAEAYLKKRVQTFSGITVGLLFLGMSFGSLMGSAIFSLLGLRGTLLIPSALAFVALALIAIAKDFPKSFSRSLKGAFKPGMIKNWYVGLAISSTSVLFGSIASTVLELQRLPQVVAVTLGGILGGLDFLGSAMGAILLPAAFESFNRKMGLILTSFLSMVSSFAVALGLPLTGSFLILAVAYFAYGFFGNAYWSMALASVASYTSTPEEAGLATSMYSVVSNVGVAVLPVYLGSLYSSYTTLDYGVGAVMAINFLAFLMALLMKS